MATFRTAVVAAALTVAVAAPAAGASASPTADRVLVVYNSVWAEDADHDGMQDSEQVARYYARIRGIPAGHLLGVACATSGAQYYYYTGQWPNFRAEVLAPIKAALAAIGPNAIDVICPCYGVPFVYFTPANSGLSVDNLLMAPNWWSDDGGNIAWMSNPYFETTPGIGVDRGHFDHAGFDVAGTPLYLVSRLDGPRGVGGVLDLIDQARYGDRYVAAASGYFHGTVYVDSTSGQPGTGAPYTDASLAASSEVASGNYGTASAADMNIAWAEHYATAAGLPVRWENTTSNLEIGEAGATFSDGSSAAAAPEALFYGGWYNFGRYNDVFSWLPGSVACDLNSDSLGYVRSGGGFGAGALNRGCTCVAGVVAEPYLTGHPRPNVLLWYLLAGYTFAEAATLATPSVGWMPIAIGDPLYAPLRARAAVRDTDAPRLEAGYPIIGAGPTADARTLTLVVADAPEPEVAQVTVDYGPTTAYGASVDSGQGWWRRHALVLTGLLDATTYHYRLRLRDPVGNTTTTGDAVFRTGGDVVGFTVPTATVDEGAGSVSLSVQHLGDGAVTVAWTTADGTAVAGSDFTAGSGVLAWSAGDNSVKTIVVPILADAVAESSERFTVTLGSASGGAAIGAGTATVTIADDDRTGVTGGAGGSSASGGGGHGGCGAGASGIAVVAAIALAGRARRRRERTPGDRPAET